MKNPLYFSLLAAVLLGCSGGKSTNPDAMNEEGRSESATHPYTVSGNQIITPAYADTSYFCFGSELETETYMLGPDTVAFSVSGNTLTLITRTDTTMSGAVVEWISNFTRSGSGAGLIGAWKHGENFYRVLSGDLTEGEKHEIDLEMAQSSQIEPFYEFSLIFTENTITTSVDILTAELFLHQWNAAIFPGDVPNSAKYDISVVIVDRLTVELRGSKTGETVRIKILPKGDRTYTSNNAGHPESRYISDSKTCPNDYEPLWFRNFKEENPLENGLLPTGKSGKKDQKSRQQPHFPFFPLKPASIFLN